MSISKPQLWDLSNELQFAEGHYIGDKVDGAHIEKAKELIDLKKAKTGDIVKIGIKQSEFSVKHFGKESGTHFFLLMQKNGDIKLIRNHFDPFYRHHICCDGTSDYYPIHRYIVPHEIAKFLDDPITYYGDFPIVGGIFVSQIHINQIINQYGYFDVKKGTYYYDLLNANQHDIPHLLLTGDLILTKTYKRPQLSINWKNCSSPS